MLDENEIAALEKKLAEKEIVLKRAQAASRLGYWKFVPSTGEVTGSEELFRIFGLGKHETNVDAFFSIVHPDDLAYVETGLQRCATFAERLDVKFRLLRRDDTQIWLRAIGEAITDESGNVLYLAGTTQDVTDIEATHKALRDSELWMQSIFNSLDEGVLVVSADRKLLNVNKAAEDIFGYTAEEIFNSSTELFHVDHQHYVEFGNRINKAFEKGNVAKFEFQSRRKNGEIFPTEHTVSLLKNPEGEVNGIVSVVKDITEKRQVEEEFERMFEISPDLLGVGNLDGYFTRVNSSFQRLLGYTDDEFMEKPFLEFVYEDDVPKTLEALMEGVNGKKYIDVSNRYKCKDGALKWIEWNVLALNEENKFYASGRDVSERKRYESELERYRYNLEDLIVERTSELRKSLAEKEVLLKEVHHRVKNNMAMVCAFLHLQMDKADDNSSRSALKACENRILAMSMVHKRLYQSDDFTSINMQVLYDEICDALHRKGGHKNVDLDIQAGKVFLEMDYAIPCALIVNELVSNSLKHAFKDKSSGKITIIMHAESDNTYRLRVSDNGVGVSNPELLENSDTLGLQLMNVFVDQLKGHVEILMKSGFEAEIVFSAS